MVVATEVATEVAPEPLLQPVPVPQQEQAAAIMASLDYPKPNIPVILPVA